MQPSSQQRPPLQKQQLQKLESRAAANPQRWAQHPDWNCSIGNNRIQQCARATGSLDAMQVPSTTSSPAAARSTTPALCPQPPWGNVPPDKAKGQSEISLESFGLLPTSKPPSLVFRSSHIGSGRLLNLIDSRIVCTIELVSTRRSYLYMPGIS